MNQNRSNDNRPQENRSPSSVRRSRHAHGINYNAKPKMALTINLALEEDVTTCRDLEALLLDVVRQFQRLIPAGPALGYKPLEISHNPFGRPLCAVGRLPDRYRILLFAGTGPFRDDYSNRDLCRLAFQLAHEMGHLYADPRNNNDFIENICWASSLFTLEDMAKRWPQHAPFPNWQSFAPNFKKYQERQSSRAKESLGDHRFNEISKLTDYFLRRPRAWRTIAFLGAGQSEIDLKNPLHNQFKAKTTFIPKLWLQALPEELRPFGEDILKL